MLDHATLSGSLAGVLTNFLNAEGLVASSCRTRLNSWKTDGRISVYEWTACLALIHQEYPRPSLGLDIALHMQFEHAGMLGYLLLSCDNLGEFFERLERFHGLMWQGFTVNITRSKTITTISWTLNDIAYKDVMDIIRLGYEAGLAGIVNMLRKLYGNTINPSSVVLVGSPPDFIQPYEIFFGCPVDFDDKTASISFAMELLTLPIYAEKASLKDLVEKQAEAQLRSLPQGDCFLKAFQDILDKALKAGKPTISHVAEEMRLSRATLQRKLKQRDLTFQIALDKTRLEMAKMYLKDKMLSLSEITFLLAYSEQSAFSRSFKRCTGYTPLNFRKNFA